MTEQLKYNIMHDYSGSFCFYTDDGNIPKDFDTVGEAIACGMELGFGSSFIIVNVVNYRELVLKINPRNV